MANVEHTQTGVSASGSEGSCTPFSPPGTVETGRGPDSLNMGTSLVWLSWGAAEMLTKTKNTDSQQTMTTAVLSKPRDVSILRIFRLFLTVTQFLRLSGQSASS